VLLSGHLVMSILGPIFFPNLLKMYKILLQSESLIDLSDTFLATIPKDVSLYSFSESVPTYVFGRISVGLVSEDISIIYLRMLY
jgi:hypothetical protein